MDRELKKYLTWTVIVAFVIIIVNALQACTMPAVVTVVEPYAALLPQDSSETYLGSMKCDLAGQPYMLLNPRLTPEQVSWVIIHERIHVSQARKYLGGCLNYAHRYETDSLFRLSQEAESFCGVFMAQRKVGINPDPDYEGIIWRLSNRYVSDYERAEVVQRMSCKPP